MLSKKSLSIGGGVVALIIALLVAWYFVSPGWTLSSMKDAAKERNAEDLAEHIDFPALRENMKGQLQARVATMVAQDKGNPFGALGAMMASAMINPMIDGMISPTGVQAMFDSNPPADPEKPVPQTAARSDDVEIVREGLSKFRVHNRTSPGKDGDLIFKRDGLSWKLVGIQLPAA